MSARRRAADTRQTVQILSRPSRNGQRIDLGICGRGRLRSRPHAPSSIASTQRHHTLTAISCLLRPAPARFAPGGRQAACRSRERARAQRCDAHRAIRECRASPSVYATSAIRASSSAGDAGFNGAHGVLTQREHFRCAPSPARGCSASIKVRSASTRSCSASHRACLAAARVEQRDGHVNAKQPSRLAPVDRRRPASDPPTIVGAGSRALRAASASSRNRSEAACKRSEIRANSRARATGACRAAADRDPRRATPSRA